MPTIRIEYEVPEEGCLKCGVFNFHYSDPSCKIFNEYIKYGKDGKYQRCQACIDAEVKE